MNPTYIAFIRATTIFRQRAESIFAKKLDYSEWQYNYLSMALLSQVWLKWCLFCRNVVILSCAGTESRTGTRIAPRAMDNSWQRIAYEIKNRNKPIRPIGQIIQFKRHEPTWGDIDVILQSLPIIVPNNRISLQTGFGMPLNGPKHIQYVRNSCYHTNDEAVKDVRNIMHYYIGAKIKHPIDLMWLKDRTGVNAIYSWIDDLENISDIVTK